MNPMEHEARWLPWLMTRAENGWCEFCREWRPCNKPPEFVRRRWPRGHAYTEHCVCLPCYLKLHREECGCPRFNDEEVRLVTKTLKSMASDP